MSDAGWGAIRAAYLQYSMICLPGQNLTPEQQVAFAARFGPLDDHREDPSYRLPGYPEIYLLGNFKRDDGRVSKTRDVGRGWHTDHSYTTRPTEISMLYCQSVPPVGGTTMWSSGYMAYDELSPKMKTIVEDLEAVHDFAWYFTQPTVYNKPKVRSVDSIRERYPAVVHPLVRVHPETGRKALYLSEALISHIVGLGYDESRSILNMLLRHALRPEFTYRHTCTPNDLVFWDNRCTMHNAPADYVHSLDTPRQMYRLTVLGTPFGRYLDEEAGRKMTEQAAEKAAA